MPCSTHSARLQEIRSLVAEYDTISSQTPDESTLRTCSFNYRVKKIRPLLKEYYSESTRAKFGKSYRGIYLLSCYDPTSFHFENFQQLIEPQGHWDYVDSGFGNKKIAQIDQERIKHLIVNPELVGTTAFWCEDPLRKILSGATTRGNLSTRLINWRIGLGPPSEIRFNSYDVVYYNQDVIRNEDRGIITNGLAAALLRPGGFVYVHSNNIVRERKVQDCKPILSHPILDHCLWQKE
jgi:hypothetical protein